MFCYYYPSGAESIISRVRLETRFRHFLHGMLQQPPDSITSSSSNNGVVVLDVGLVEEQFATLASPLVMILVLYDSVHNSFYGSFPPV